MHRLDKSIVLIGMPGCGKTSIGRLLAQKLGRPFIDIDRLLEEQTGSTVKQLFNKGEGYFRRLESEAVLALENMEASVISTGGGVVKKAENMESLKKNGVIVYIDRAVKDIAGDVDISTRPLLAGGPEQLRQLYSERDALYKKYSDLIVKNEGEIMAVIDNIIDKIFNLEIGVI